MLFLVGVLLSILFWPFAIAWFTCYLTKCLVNDFQKMYVVAIVLVLIGLSMPLLIDLVKENFNALYNIEIDRTVWIFVLGIPYTIAHVLYGYIAWVTRIRKPPATFFK